MVFSLIESVLHPGPSIKITPLASCVGFTVQVNVTVCHAIYVGVVCEALKSIAGV